MSLVGVTDSMTPGERATVAQELWERYDTRSITRTELRREVIRAWVSCDTPHLHLTNSQWRAMFRAAGYTSNGEAATPPSEPVLLYRAAPPTRQGNWSWSPNLAVAQYFQRTGAPGPVDPTPMASSVLWTCVVPPDRLLARIKQDFRIGGGLTASRAVTILYGFPPVDEYVADVDGLDIQRYG
ncbi:Uncharacterised protein [Mycobacteroides abscessus subsp. abscessus]|nr:Uncharacterised protein [Mycobacteroides abscessus subsp. abscessus]SID11668.1 Uncharacterised protein [Mycobacteroides abscessus subsp. abscessus]SIE18475.1 Uncharacterised protein [Mycobacteroides abscessus subsp. abscessus]SIH46794.1 Uncharacterised protein [Mycobacteroides abscessus subsp. abscessus]SKK57952.1 Uncharacterised protein [Mycobacteroides abscessus subsp. abscessus]